MNLQATVHGCYKTQKQENCMDIKDIDVEIISNLCPSDSTQDYI